MRKITFMFSGSGRHRYFKCLFWVIMWTGYTCLLTGYRRSLWPVWCAGAGALLSALLYKSSAAPREKNWETVLSRLVYILFSVLAAITIVELILRLRSYPPYNPIYSLLRWDRKAIAENYPNLRKVLIRDVETNTNSMGFRGMREYKVVKTPGLTRILITGDSTTFGYGVSDEENYPARLEKLLQEKLPDRQWEVINTGIPGATSHHIRALLPKWLTYQPDIVTVSCAVNDGSPLWDWGVTRPFGEEGWSGPCAIWFANTRLGRWNSGKVLQGGIWLAQKRLSQRGPPSERADLDAPVVSLQKYEENLLAIQNLSNHAGANVIFFPFPMPLRYWLEKGFEERLSVFERSSALYGDRMISIAKERGITYLDIRSVFWKRESEYPAERGVPPEYLSGDSAHASPRGHEIIAGELYRKVIEVLEKKTQVEFHEEAIQGF